MRFKNRDHYIKWVFRNFIDPYDKWKALVPEAPGVLSPFEASDKAAPVPLVATFGMGVVGGLQIALPRSFRGAAVWIAASSAERRALRALLPHPKVAVVPYPLDDAKLNALRRWRGTPGWRRARAAFYAKHRLDPTVPTFYFCGRITPSKGLHHLALLAEKQKFKIQLVLAGMREKAERAPGEDAAAWRALHHSQHCHTVNLERITALQNYRYLTFVDSCATLSTDASEDFGFLPRQALALGTPALFTSWGGLLDIQLPKALDRKLIHRLAVKPGPFPELSRLGLSRYFEKLAEISESDRISGAEAFLRNHRSETVSGLRQAIAMRESLLRSPAERARASTSFGSFSRGLILASASQGLLDARIVFPRKLQLKLMTDKR